MNLFLGGITPRVLSAIQYSGHASSKISIFDNLADKNILNLHLDHLDIV